MGAYNSILVAVDLGADSDAVVKRARSVGQGAEIHLAHVLEPMIVEGGYDLLPPLTMDTDAGRKTHAEKALCALGGRWDIGPERCHLVVGPTKVEIINLAEQLSADLIAVGSHGRHGLALLLGSTANAVLHGARCDVLAVRVADHHGE